MNAASVLPDPVGETTRVSLPVAIACHASDCTWVGAANARENQVRVAEVICSGRSSLATCPLWGTLGQCD